MMHQIELHYWIFDNNTHWPILSFGTLFLDLLKMAPVDLKAEPSPIQHIQSDILLHLFANFRCELLHDIG